MGIRMTLGGEREGKHHGSEHYTEGYNAGYTHAVEEMRRRARSIHPMHDDIEDRRGRRARSEHEHHMPMDDVHWPIESRQIGFISEPHERHMRMPGHEPYHDPMHMLMNMMHDLKEGQEHIKHGMASATKKLDPRLEGVLESALQVMENPPSTWEQYKHLQDYRGIVKMEGKELLAALEAGKPIQDIRKELTHTIAALFQMVFM